MGIGLGCTNGQTGRLGDLTEAKVKRIFECDHRRLRPRKLGEARAKLTSRFGGERCGGRITVDGRAIISDERLGAARESRLREILARVHNEPVQPGCELRITSELTQPHDEFGKRILARIARILGIAQKVQSNPLHPRLVSNAKHFQCRAITVLCPLHEDGVGKTLEIESDGVGRVIDSSTAGGV